MNRILDLFRAPRVLLPVIHCIDRIQARENIDLAFASGADGVFLINQGGMTAGQVLDLAAELEHTNEHRPRFVGVNALGDIRPASLINRPGCAGVWSDDCGVHGTPLDALTTLSRFRVEREQTGWHRGLWFGGVGFKYQRPIPDESLGYMAVLAALGGVDVITTSGPATGAPPSAERIAGLREALGDHAIGIASGISIENVAAFLPYANAFLVATGIESSFGHLDAAKVRALADVIHAGP